MNSKISTSPVKVGFILLSRAAEPVPSTRVAVLNMFPHLKDAGFAPEIIYEPPSATERPQLEGVSVEHIVAQGFRIVCFQKVGGTESEALAKGLSARGIKTVFVVCDVVDEGMAQATDATVVVTDFLKQLYPAALQHKISTVHDGIERPEIQRSQENRGRGTRRRPLHAVLVTSALLDEVPVFAEPPPWLRITVVGRYPSGLGLIPRMRYLQWRLRQMPDLRRRWSALKFSLHPRIQCVPWHPEEVYQWLQSADIGIIPIDTPPDLFDGEAVPRWMVKSENRLTLKMAIGLPVVATPIPSYESVVEQGVNGFMARDRAQWLQSLEALRDPLYRQQVGRAARASVLNRFSMAEQARKLVGVLTDVLNSR